MRQDCERSLFSGASTIQFVTAVTLPMLIPLACAKAMTLRWAWWNLRFPVKWACMEIGDMAFVLGWALAGTVAIAFVSRPRKLRTFVRWAFILASLAIVVYSVVNVWVYWAVGVPLTYRMLRLAGTYSDLRSSISPYATFAAAASVACTSVGYLLFVFLALQFRSLMNRGLYRVLFAALVLYFPLALYGHVRLSESGEVDALGASPQCAFLQSCIDDWRGEANVAENGDSPASYRDEFRTAGDRTAWAAAPRRDSPIKNVIVVVMESTGTDFLGVYGKPYRTTPNLEVEAKHSILLRNFCANDGMSACSMMPLILSVYPGTGWTVYASEHPRLAGTTAAQVLQKRGYRTAFMTSGKLEFMGMRRFLDSRGFDAIMGCEDFVKLGLGTPLSSWGMGDKPLFDQMLQWIAQAGDRPFYLVAWTLQTHHPYSIAPGQQVSPLGGDGTAQGQLLNNYLNNLRQTDAELGRLFATLRDRHLERSTLVVITGDHGEAFGIAHPCFCHGTALYQECVNVPCILWSPSLFDGGIQSDVVGSHVDLNPTIFDLMGLPVPASWQGLSLLNTDRPYRAYFTCCTGNLLQGLRQGNDKYIYNLTLQREELFDLATDPTEQHNKAAQEPDACKTYRDRLAAWSTFEKVHLADLVARN